MRLSAVRHWFGQPSRPPPVRPGPGPGPGPRAVGEASARIEGPVAAPSGPVWTEHRLVIAAHLWGEGFLFPGGEIEVLRLAKPLGLSGATTVLLVGAGAGGAACSLAAKTGAWVSGFEADDDLLAAATYLVARKNQTRRVRLERWSPEAPAFEPRQYHYGMALEPLRAARPEPVLAALAHGLKPGAHLAMTASVADAPLDRADPVVGRWAALDRRDPDSLPAERTVTRILGRLGFDVRVAEDISQRHVQQATTGWRAAFRAVDDLPPPRPLLEAYAREAELWACRLRLFQSGRLRMVRWHGILGG
jgi:SAM-dependent methyltransferase